MTARTTAQIALGRAIETAVSVGIVGAAVSAGAALVAALSACIPPPPGPLPIGDVVVLGCTIGLRAILLAFVVAVGSGIVNYVTATISANKNQSITGTTAPVGTVAAPNVPVVGGVQLIAPSLPVKGST